MGLKNTYIGFMFMFNAKLVGKYTIDMEVIGWWNPNLSFMATVNLPGPPNVPYLPDILLMKEILHQLM